MSNVDKVLAKFAEKYQQPFEATKILVPGFGDPFWSVDYAYRDLEFKHLIVDGSNLVWYTLPEHSHAWFSEPLKIYPSGDNRYKFPLKIFYWYPDKYFDNYHLLSFHPQYEVEGIRAWLAHEMDSDCEVES